MELAVRRLVPLPGPGGDVLDMSIPGAGAERATWPGGRPVRAGTGTKRPPTRPEDRSVVGGPRNGAPLKEEEKYSPIDHGVHRSGGSRVEYGSRL